MVTLVISIKYISNIANVNSQLSLLLVSTQVVHKYKKGFIVFSLSLVNTQVVHKYNKGFIVFYPQHDSNVTKIVLQQHLLLITLQYIYKHNHTSHVKSRLLHISINM